MHVSSLMSQASDYEINASVAKSNPTSITRKVPNSPSKHVLSPLNYYRLFRTFV